MHFKSDTESIIIMKHITLTLLLLSAQALSVNAKEWQFPPELEELITKYEKTAEPVLPEAERIRQIDQESLKYSAAPGTLALTHNIIINKRSTRIYVVNCFGDTLASYPVCCARNRGHKQGKDDCRTPEGTFEIAGVYNSTDWRYKGTGAKCYGPYFISLITPGFWGIGIHGTNSPGSVPGRSSHGCIRVHNENIVKIKPLVNKDTRVTILPDDPEKERKAIEKIKAAYVPPIDLTLYSKAPAATKSPAKTKSKKSRK